MKSEGNDKIIIYSTVDGKTKLDIRLENDTIWLSQAQMVELFQTTKQNVSLHIRNAFFDDEVNESSVVKEYLTTAADGKSYKTKYYNLDVVLAVGYRVKSLRGTQFRQWASTILLEYLQKGFAMNDDLLKNSGGGYYWKELLERIRDIRSSEKVFYRQLLDLFATSVDYDNKSETCKAFFKIVQNKMHYAVNKQTAAELVNARADSTQPFMGIKSFSGKQPTKDEALIAKNYLEEKELAVLNRMVSAFFELAELHALNHEHLYMKDWLPQVDDFANRYGKGILQNAGSVSHKTAIEKATEEYKKYKVRMIDVPTSAELDYLQSIKAAQKKIDRKK